MGNKGSEWLMKTKDSEGGLEAEPGFLRPRSGPDLQAPLFFPVLKATCAFVTQSCCVTPLRHRALLNSCAQHQHPRVQPLPRSLQYPTLTSPFQKLSISRSLADPNNMSQFKGRSGSVKRTGGRARFIMGHNYLAVHWQAPWHSLPLQTALPPLIAIPIAGAVMTFISRAALHSARTQMIKWPSQLPPLPIKRLQEACEIKKG